MVRYCPLEHAESHWNPVLRDAEAVHAGYLDVEADLGCSAKIGYVVPERKPRNLKYPGKRRLRHRSLSCNQVKLF